MNRRLTLLAALGLVLAAAPAQHDVEALAAALVAAQAPAVDDPDAIARDLLAAAARAGRSPVAALIVAEAARGIAEVQDPAALLRELAVFDGQRLHGLCAQELDGLRWRLQRAVEPPSSAPAWPLQGHAEAVLAVGPFGDGGDAFVGVPFAPEFEFPELGTMLAGAGGPAVPRLARRGTEWRSIQLAAPGRASNGCHYGRWRVVAADAIDGFLELEHDGDSQVFVDGAEVLRVERWRPGHGRRARVGMALPAGGHEIVVKTANADRSRVALRFVDAEGAPLAGLRPHDGAGEFVRGAAATRTAATFVTGEAMLARLAGENGASDAVRIAAVLAAVRDGQREPAIDLAMALHDQPPTDPPAALAFARVLRLVDLPDELRKAWARALEERAVPALLPDHHEARIAQAQLHEEQDQREQALRLLAAHPAPGPRTFARRAELLRQLRFRAELAPWFATWSEQCPSDARPLAQWAQELAQAGANREAAALRARSLVLRPDQPSLARTVAADRIAAGDPVDAEAIAAAWPAFGGDAPLGRLRLHREWALARGDAGTARELAEAIADHAETTGAVLLDLAGDHARAGDDARVRTCLERCAALGDATPAVRSWLASVRGEVLPIDELAAFRRDGDAAIAAFTPGERERGASTTVLVDQTILAVAADGSWTAEGHALRRINDQAGVEAFREQQGLGRFAELLSLRTRAADGSDWVPSRVDGDYALTRLQPGAFVEWRWREHGEAPGARPFATEPFFFGSAQEPIAVAEYVVVLPSGRGELRTRGLPAPARTATLADGRTVQIHTRTDVPALGKERHLPPLLDLLPVLAVGEDTPLQPTLREHRVELGRRTRLTAALRAAADAAIAGIAEPAARAQAIWTFCQSTIEDGPADDALQTLLRKKGSRFLLAVALWRAAGLEVLPMACRDARAELGSGASSLFADAEAGQVPGVLLVLPGGQRLPAFLDSPRHWPLGDVPAARGGTVATVVHDDRCEPFPLRSADGAAQHLEIRGKAGIAGKDLVLTMTARIGDVQGFQLAEQLRQQKANVRTMAARQIAQQMFPGWRVDAAALAKDEPGQPLGLQATLRRGGVQPDGERFVLALPLPATRFGAAFGDRAERAQPWRLAIDLLADTRIEFDPGEELRLAALPPDVWLAEEPLVFRQDVQRDGERVVITRHVRLGSATRPAAAFGDWLRALAAADRAEQQTLELIARRR